MKTVQQLLELAKNPHYKFMPDEQRVLDAFLAKRRATRSPQSQRENSTESSPRIPVTVRNIVEPVDTYAPDDRSVAQSDSEDENQ